MIKSQRLLIGVVSCSKHNDRRESCRQSWMKNATDRFNIDTFFITGDTTSKMVRRGGDTLYVPSDDDYQSLPQKTWQLAIYAQKNGYSHLFKCDDDTFLYIPRLVSMLSKEPEAFVGYTNAPGMVSGGAGYLLNTDAINILVNNMGKIPFGTEDVIVSVLLREAGIALSDDQRFCPLNRVVPSLYNEQISCHRIDSSAMRALHNSLESSLIPSITKIDGVSEYGSVGVLGYRGFSANGRSTPKVAKPNVHSSSLISAHASSRVQIEITSECTIFGMMDSDAKDCKAPVEFHVDGKYLGTLTRENESTKAIPLKPGCHELCALALGKNDRCYSLWNIDSNSNNND